MDGVDIDTTAVLLASELADKLSLNGGTLSGGLSVVGDVDVVSSNLNVDDGYKLIFDYNGRRPFLPNNA